METPLFPLAAESAARPPRRAALLLLVLLCAFAGYLGWRWVVTAPLQSADATQEATPAPDALITLWADGQLVRGLQQQLTLPQAQQYALLADGQLTALQNPLQSTRRPSLWWLPNVIGSLTVSGGTVHPILTWGNVLTVVGLPKPTTPQLLRIPSRALAGAPLRCQTPLCAELTGRLASPAMDVPDGTGVFFVQGEQTHTFSFVSFPPNETASAQAWAREAAGALSPATRTRTLADGRTLTEYVAAQDLPKTSLQVGNANAVRIGEAGRDLLVVQTSFGNLVFQPETPESEAVSVLSTLPWTRHVCGRKSYWFFSPSGFTSSSEVYALSRAARSLRLCVQE